MNGLDRVQVLPFDGGDLFLKLCHGLLDLPNSEGHTVLCHQCIDCAQRNCVLDKTYHDQQQALLHNNVGQRTFAKFLLRRYQIIRQPSQHGRFRPQILHLLAVHNIL